MIACRKCGVEKPREAFKANELRPRHGSKWCRECSSEYQRQWKEKRRRANGVPVKEIKYLTMQVGQDLYRCRRCAETKGGREFSASNLKPRGRGWCRSCVTDHVRSGRPYEILLASAAKYRASGKASARIAAWRKSPVGKAAVIEYAHRRRAATVRPIPKGFYEKLLCLQRGLCAVCRAHLVKPQIDHIKPIALGGEHSTENLQLLCKPCNQRKHAKDPIAFMQSRGFLL
jgi:5-methylcytosine-specific restriction endonuclease McrA